MTTKEDALKTVDRMKTETIHAQSLQIKYLTERLIAAEDEIKRLATENRSLKLKLTSANKTVAQLQGGT